MLGNAAKTGFFLVALGFPLYLIWRGRGSMYLQLATVGGMGSSALATAQTQIQENAAGNPPVIGTGSNAAPVPYIGFTPTVPGLIPGVRPGA